ncbi:MAG: hypothetical protein M1826_002823 [Phylliscum demangeonii]|nr:MAG: hypothetical protein M1826_002823 [Phylliscum demangeonii]
MPWAGTKTVIPASATSSISRRVGRRTPLGNERCIHPWNVGAVDFTRPPFLWAIVRRRSIDHSPALVRRAWLSSMSTPAIATHPMSRSPLCACTARDEAIRACMRRPSPARHPSTPPDAFAPCADGLHRFSGPRWVRTRSGGGSSTVVTAAMSDVAAAELAHGMCFPAVIHGADPMAAWFELPHGAPHTAAGGRRLSSHRARIPRRLRRCRIDLEPS